MCTLNALVNILTDFKIASIAYMLQQLELFCVLKIAWYFAFDIIWINVYPNILNIKPIRANKACQQNSLAQEKSITFAFC